MQEPQPQLAELLRTCVHPPSLLLQIVHIEFLDVKNQEESQAKSSNGDSIPLADATHRYAVKYILSDGEIMMQALLHRKLTGLRDVADVVIGDLLDIRRFAIKQTSRSEGLGRVIYLAIEDCHFLQRLQSHKRAPNEEQEETAKKTWDNRKRKRANSHSGIETTNPGYNLHIETADVVNETKGPPPAKRPSLHHTSDQLAASARDPPSHSQHQTNKLRQPAQAHTSGTLHSQSHQPRTAGQVHKEPTKMKRSSLSANESNKADGHSKLSNIFGARQVIVDEEEDDFFQTLPTNQDTIKQRRRALQKLDGNASFNSQMSSMPDDPGHQDDLTTPSKPPKLQPITTHKGPATIVSDQVPLAPPPAVPAPVSAVPAKLLKKSVRDGTFALSQAPTFYQPQQPPATIKQPQPPPRQAQTQPVPQSISVPALLPSPPFHTLASLRNPPGSQGVPSKSYTLTTLAVISWTGTTTIHRPGSLFPPKRHLKIVDPSLATSRPPSRQVQGRQPTREPNSSSFKAQNSFQDAVTVAVYIDAANFTPAPGTLVLFRGLVMQRLVNGDVILNAYGRLKEQRFEESEEESLRRKKEDNNLTKEPTDKQETESTTFDNHWFITDQAKIRKLGHGSRLDYYLDWWTEKQRAQQQTGQNQS